MILRSPETSLNVHAHFAALPHQSLARIGYLTVPGVNLIPPLEQFQEHVHHQVRGHLYWPGQHRGACDRARKYDNLDKSLTPCSKEHFASRCIQGKLQEARSIGSQVGCLSRAQTQSLAKKKSHYGARTFLDTGVKQLILSIAEEIQQNYDNVKLLCEKLHPESLNLHLACDLKRGKIIIDL